MSDPAAQDPVIEHLIRWGKRRPSVRAMVLTSSRAVPHAPVDVLSDYDVILAVRDVEPYYVDRAWLAACWRICAACWNGGSSSTTGGR